MCCMCSPVLASLLFQSSFKPDLRSKNSPLSSVSFEKFPSVFLNLKNLAVSQETFSTVVLKVKAVLLLYSRDSKMEGCALLYIFSSKWFLLFTLKKITSSILKLMTFDLIICNLFLSSTAGPPGQASPCLWLTPGSLILSTETLSSCPMTCFYVHNPRTTEALELPYLLPGSYPLLLS